MTHYVAEAKRLGVAIPIAIQFSTDAKYRSARAGYRGRTPVDDEGLCISGCGTCRQFRDTVRDALEAERVSKFEESTLWEYDLGFAAGYEAGCAAGRREAQRLLVADLRDLADELETI